MSPLNWTDIRFGLEKGFLDRDDVIELALDFVSRNENADERETELAGLLKDEVHRVPDIITILTPNYTPNADTDSKWLYLPLAWVYAQRDSIEDPLGAVERIYSNFNYPERVSPFVRYMPPSDDYRPQDYTPDENRERLFRLWYEYLLEHHPS